jgi:hypothetical protein
MTIIDRRLYVRSLSNQKADAKIVCNVRNGMTSVGMPISVRIKQDANRTKHNLNDPHVPTPPASPKKGNGKPTHAIRLKQINSRSLGAKPTCPKTKNL